ncbi:CDP-diacylglycerol diphosphatase [Methylobacterium oryzihabitans]|nr:CDP-diacylglycerol diphosphatase [Methylobacterium oryzihabitans]
MACLPARAAPDLSRDVLWVALQGCLLNKRTTGRAFPCLSVDPGDRDRPGTAVLRAPGEPTHLVVMPTADVVGVEAPDLQTPKGAVYWRAALAARREVSAAIRGGRPLDEIGLAVNSSGGRSQDQLHIHVDCVRASVLAELRQRAGIVLPGTWTGIPLPVGERRWRRFLAMRISLAQAEAFNPFEAATRLPGAGRKPAGPDLTQVSLAMVSTPPGDPHPGYIVLAHRSPTSHAETLLDHRCAAPVR